MNAQIHQRDRQHQLHMRSANSPVSSNPTSINPVNLLHSKSNIDPATTTTTNIKASSQFNSTSESTSHSNSTSTVSASLNPILSTLSDSDTEFDPKQIFPTQNSYGNQDQPNNTNNFIKFKPTEKSSFSINHHNNDLTQQKRLPASTSHSKLSDLAHKVSDFLFSTRRSIDASSLQPNHTMTHSSSQSSESTTPSPITSRNSSFASLNSIVRSNGSRVAPSKRKSFLFRSNNNNNTSNSNNNNTIMMNTNASNTSINSNTSQTICHFSCNINDSSANKTASKVKETHYVHVEYDPVTRKRVLNTYEILKDLGSGQHGKVKLAKDIATGKKVAIKIVDRTGKPALMLSRLSRGGKVQTQEDKIRREIAIMKKCDHPHVVKLIEVLDAENSRKIYLVLEYLEKGEIKWQLSPEEVYAKLTGENISVSDVSGDIALKNCVSEPLLTLDQTKNIFRDVLSGLEYLHYQGIIHRDIKPSNLLVSHDGVVKISDFGVSFATNLDGQNQDEIELAKTAGTPAFLAPELCGTECKSDLKFNYKIDIWALGVTLYCLIFGCLPFYADSEYQLFQNICNDEVKFPDMTRWRVAKPLSSEDYEICKDLLLKLLDKNPKTRIEIDDIKRHPFVINDLKDKIWTDDYSKMNQKKKIDVSNEEMDDAVVGLGNRIKKKLSQAFGKRQYPDSTSSIKTLHNNNHSNSGSLLKSYSMAALKDDCSYILSEENDDNATINNNTIDGFIDTSQVSLSLLDKNISSARQQSSKSTTGLSTTNAVGKVRTPELKQAGIVSHEPLGMSSPSHLSNTVNIDNSSCDESSESYESCENADDSGAEGEEEEPDQFDYRRILARHDNKESDSNSTNLSVNPSFASLDSFYDDSYSKFIQQSTNAGSAAYNGFGSYTGRTNNGRITSNYMGNRASPNLIPSNPNIGNVHSADTRDCLSMGRKTSSSPTTSGTFMLPAAIQNNLHSLRGISRRVSPAHSSTNIHSSNNNTSTLRSPKQVPMGLPVNPMLNNIGSNSNVTSSSPTNKTSFQGGGSKKAIFANMINSDSSDDDDDDDEKPIEFSKFRGYNKPASSSGVNGKVNSINNSIVNSADPETISSVPLVLPITEKSTSQEDNILPTRSAIYGTRLNLVHKFDDSSRSSNESESDDSEEELFISFGKPKGAKVVPNNSKSPTPINSRPRAVQRYISAENIMNVTTPTIVDVPANIFESQQNSLGNNDEDINDESVPSYVISDSGAVEDEIALLKIDDDDDDSCDQ